MGADPQFPDLPQNLAGVRAAIAASCRKSGRPEGEISLMAVTKTHPAAAISEAAALGVTVFGENRVQEFQAKSAGLSFPGNLSFHLIGHLQSNKSTRAAGLFHAIDSIDSLHLARRLNDAAQKLDKPLPVLLEIKLSPEAAKTGLLPESPELADLLEQLPELPALQLRGLMSVPPLSEDPEAARPYFRQLRRLRDQLAETYPHLEFHELSMGMSHDFPVAIEEGATMIRLGTALFGPRTAAAS